jgi:histidine triad (HIT) family protein
MASIFTKIIKGEIPCYKIAENDRFIAILDAFPLVKGHTLIIPKVEVDYIFDLEDNLLSEMILFSKKIATAIESAIPCNRIGVTIIGLEVPHAHVHLIPINNESDMNFKNPKLKLRKEDFETILKEIKEKL